MRAVIALAIALAAPAHAGSLPQVPGVVLDDTYAPVSKAAAPPPRRRADPAGQRVIERSKNET